MAWVIDANKDKENNEFCPHFQRQIAVARLQLWGKSYSLLLQHSTHTYKNHTQTPGQQASKPRRIIKFKCSPLYETSLGPALPSPPSCTWVGARQWFSHLSEWSQCWLHWRLQVRTQDRHSWTGVHRMRLQCTLLTAGRMNEPPVGAGTEKGIQGPPGGLGWNLPGAAAQPPWESGQDLATFTKRIIWRIF